MATKVTALTVNRNTAVSAAGILQQPAVAMTSESIPEGSYLFGFEPTIPANEHWVFAADAEATKEPNQCYSEPFQLVTWAVKRINITDLEGGPDIVHARLILIDPNDETLSFVSVGALGSLDLIRTLRGDGPYDPPIPIIVQEAKTRGNFRVYKLRIVHERGKQPAVK